MGIHSGKFGVVDGVSTVRTWSINDSMSPKNYVASNTEFGTGRRKSLEEWGGSFGSYGHTPPVMPGAQFAFIGYTAPNDDSNGVGLRYEGDAVVENVQVDWNWGAGEIIACVTNFQGHLALEHPDGPEIFDLTVPRVPEVVLTRFDYSVNGSDWFEIPNLLTGQLTLSCQLQEYVNSSTAVDGRMWKGRKSGPIDWTLALTQQDVERDLFEKGDSIQLRLYVNETEYYELKWGMVGEFTGIQVDRETGAIIQQTINVSMDGYDPSEGTYEGSRGHVLLPGGTQWWPAAQPGTGT